MKTIIYVLLSLLILFSCETSKRTKDLVYNLLRIAVDRQKLKIINIETIKLGEEPYKK